MACRSPEHCLIQKSALPKISGVDRSRHNQQHKERGHNDRRDEPVLSCAALRPRGRTSRRRRSSAICGIGHAVPPDHALPARGKSHPSNFWYGSRRNFRDGSRRLRWNSFCWAAFLANAATCSSVSRLSFGRAIHSRMIFRRVSWSSMFVVPWLLYRRGASARHLRSR